jgi:GT2 family glycosyltransferase
MNSSARRTARSIAVIIPTLNESATLAKSLDAIFACAISGDVTVEIVVADDGSVDATIDVAKRYGERVRISSGTHSGTSAARNRGASEATSELLVFLDSGDLPHVNWLEQIVQAFDNPDVGLATWPANASDVEGRTAVLMPSRLWPEAVVGLSGCFALRRSIFEEVGGYDPLLRYGENTDLCERVVQRCRELGLRVVCQAELAIELNFSHPASHYDRARFEAARHLLVRDRVRLASDTTVRARLHGIAAVNAARCEEWAHAREHSLAAVRAQPRRARGYARALTTFVPPLARRLWHAPGRRTRIRVPAVNSPTAPE